MNTDEILAALRQVQEALRSCEYTKSSWEGGSSENFYFSYGKINHAEKQLPAIIAAVEEQQNTVAGLREDLRQLIRVVLTNPTDAAGFVQANYHKEYTELAKHA